VKDLLKSGMLMNGSLNANTPAEESSSESVVFNSAHGSKNVESGTVSVCQFSIGKKERFDSGKDRSPASKGSPNPRS
jgi:hypothetical protein